MLSCESCIRQTRLRDIYDAELGTVDFAAVDAAPKINSWPALKVLGMERAFDPNRAEFDGIETEQPPIWLDQVLHRAGAEVNEEGTEVTAATLVGQCMSAGNQRPQRQFRMIVDRSFFVVIRDETAGTILFMGWVGDPE